MLDTIDNGGPAFPSKFTVGPNENKPDGTRTGPNERAVYIDLGMSLRDYFAGQALAGMCAHPCGLAVTGDEDLLKDAQLSYRFADAMLKARESL